MKDESRSPAKTPTVLAIIVNYRTAELTLRAIASLHEELAAIDGSRLVVVDNASEDGSFERLTEAVAQRGWSERVSVVLAPTNGGYAYGINFAVLTTQNGGSRPDLFYVMNPDAEAEPGAVRVLVNRMRDRPDVGVAGSYLVGTDGEVQCSRFRFPSVWSEIEDPIRLGFVSRALHRRIVAMGPSLEDGEVDWITGCSLMVRREVFEAVGLFDDRFFLYFEETDFCHRARKAGFNVLYVAGSRVRHVGSVLTKMQDRGRPMPAYWYASRRRYFLKHHGPTYLTLCNVAWALCFASFRLRSRLVGPRENYRPGMLRDFLRYSFLPPPSLGLSP